MPICDDRHIEYGLAEWLRRKRRALDLDQKDVGSAIGVSHAAVHLWETGARSPMTLARWKAWSRAVNCKLEITLVDTDGERHSF